MRIIRAGPIAALPPRPGGHPADRLEGAAGPPPAAPGRLRRALARLVRRRHPDRYLAAHRAILAGDLAAPTCPRRRPRAPPAPRRPRPPRRPTGGPPARCSPAHRIGPAARVGAFSFVDTGARVDGALEDAVVWPGVHVPGALAHAIALPGEIVQLPAATRRAPRLLDPRGSARAGKSDAALD
ncbi:MAG: hypothetical protein R3F43_15195 [bacterium]